MFFDNWRKWLNHTFRGLRTRRLPLQRVGLGRFRPQVLVLEDRITPVAGITATKLVDLATAHPGSTLTYSVAITNNAGSDATGVQYIDTVDANTTFVSNSVKVSPMAISHSYNAAGNTQLSVTGGTNLGLKAGVLDIDNGTTNANIVVTAGTFATSQGGSVTIAADGSFTYTPQTGDENLTDTFTYTVTDTDNLSSTGVVSINLGARVWYVDSTYAGANGVEDGSNLRPFNSLADITGNTGPDAINDIIFVKETAGDYDGNLTLLNGQQLYGSGADLTVNTININTAGANTTLTTTATAEDSITLDNGNTVKGFTIGNTTGIKLRGQNIGTLTISNITLQGSGEALNLDNGTVNGTIDSLSTTSSPTNSVSLTALAGNLSITTGAISGAGASASDFFVKGGTGTISYGGTITNSTAVSANVQNKTGGTVTFSGLITDTAGSFGILLLNNTGATINFTGGLSLATTTNAAFTATGGGTINVTQNNTSIVNTITTTSGTALKVANTTIGTSGLTFRSITAGTGSVSAGVGISLDTTGATAGLTVTGNGNAAGHDGGTIQHKTGADGSTSAGIGIYLNSTKNVSLTNMFLHDFDNYAIFGKNVTNLTLSNTTIIGTNGNNSSLGDIAAVGDNSNEGSVRLDNLLGSSLITNSVIGNDGTTGGAYNNLQVFNAATLTQLDIESSNIYNRNIAQGVTTAGNDAFLFESASGSSISMTLIVNSSHFLDARSTLIDTNALGNSVMDITVTNSDFSNWGHGLSGGGGLIIGGGGAGNNISVTFDVEFNSFLEGGHEGGVALEAVMPGGAGTFYGKFINNTIGNAAALSGTGQASAPGLGVDIEGNDGSSVTAGAKTGPSKILINGNTIQQYGEEGILLRTNSGSATVNATVFGNTVENPQSTAFAGIYVDVGANPGDSNTMNVVIGSKNTLADKNTLTGSAPAGGGDDVSLSQAFSGVVNLSKNGSAAATAENVILDDNIFGGDSGLQAYAESGTITLVNTLPSTPPLLLDTTGGVTPVAAPVADAPGSPDTDTTAVAEAPASPEPIVSSVTTDLRQDELDVIVAAALHRWELTGLTAEQIAVLEQASFTVSGALPGVYLGAESAGHVDLSASGGGFGWFVDPTPNDDSEFSNASSATRSYTTPDQAPAGHFDLLTTVEHEMGHLLGLDDHYDAASRDDLMFGYLTFGERRTPSFGEASGAIAGSETGVDFLGLPTTIGTISNGTTINLTFQVTIKTTAQGFPATTTSVSNTGQVSSNFPTVSTTTATTQVPQADLKITKTDGQSLAVPGMPITYTIVVTNNGPSDVTGASVQDLPPVSLTGVTFTSTHTGTVSGNTTSGSVGINDTVSMSSGATITYTVHATVDSSATGTIPNTATVNPPALGPGTATDPDMSNNSDTDTDDVAILADLGVTKDDGGATTAVPGSPITYTIVVTNNGSTTVTNATVKDTFPVSLTGASYTSTHTGTVTGNTGEGGPPVSGNINDTVDMSAGATITYTVTGTIASSATGTIDNTATVAVDPAVYFDTNTANDSATDSDTLVRHADLAITKDDSVSNTTPGASLTYTIVVTNNGPSDVSGASVVDTFTADFTNVSYTSTHTGTVSGNSGEAGAVSGNINDVSVSMSSGATITYLVSVTVSNTATGSVSNTATVTAPGGTIDTGGNNSATDTDSLGPVVTSPAAPTTVNAASFNITGTAAADSLVKVYTDINNNGAIDGLDAVVASQQLTGGATSFSIPTSLTQNAANNFLVTATDSSAVESAPTDVPTITEDSIAPTVTINQAAGQVDPTNISPIHFTVVFSEAVSDFATGDVTLSGTAGATTAIVTGSGTTYDIAVSGMTSDGTVIATLNAGVVHDAASNASDASTSTDNSVTYDTLAPTVTIDQASTQVDPTNTSTIHFTVVFSEAVSDFATGDVTLNGTAGATTATVTGGGTTYDIAVSGMTSDGTVIAKLNSGVAHDAAGNASDASTSTDNTVTYDTLAPTVTIDQAITQVDPTNSSPIHFTVVFSEAVSDFATGDVTLSGTAGATTAIVTGSGTTYDIAVSGMASDGTVIAQLNAGVAHDAAGNASDASTSTDNSVTYDTLAPTVTINQASTQVDPTNTSPIHFTVVFSEAVSDFATGDVTLSGTAGATTAIVTGGGTTYDITVSGMTSDGTVIAKLNTGVAHDTAGNASDASTSTDNSVTYDTLAPTVTINQASTQVDPTNTSPIHFTVAFSEAVSDFATGDVTLSGTAGATTAIVTGSGTTYDIAVSGMTSDGTVIAKLAAGVAHDAASNASDASTSTDNTVTYDTLAPTVTIDQASTQVDPTNTSPIHFTVVFSEAVSDFATGDVTLSGTAGATMAIVTGSGTTYDIAVSGMTSDGTVIAKLNAGVAHDAAGNASDASTSTDNSVTYDATPPTVTIDQASTQVDPTNTSPIHFTVVFSEAVSDFATGDVTLSGTAGATTAIVTGSGTTYDIAVSGMTSDGTVIAKLAAGVAHDAAGNANDASTSSDNSVTYDTTKPTVAISAPTTALVGGAYQITYTITYADANFDHSTLTVGDVTINHTGSASATAVVSAGTGTTRTVTLKNVTGTGNLSISLAANTAVDKAGNQADAAGPSATVTVKPPVFTSANNTARTAGTPFTFQLSASGNPTAVTFSLSGAPGWLSVNSAGQLVGTPPPTSSTHFDVHFTIKAKNGVAPDATQAFTLHVNPKMTFSPQTLPPYKIGQPYFQTITTAGGTGTRTVTYTLSGPLPTGMTISPLSPTTGTITIKGIPTTSKSVTIKMKVTDSVGATTTITYILRAPLSIHWN